jgi:dihydroxy-acid dehydratase
MVGGPLAVVENGDTITIDADSDEITLAITDAEMQKRLSAWVAPEPNVKRGVLAKYAKTVGSASEGALTDKF